MRRVLGQAVRQQCRRQQQQLWAHPAAPWRQQGVGEDAGEEEGPALACGHLRHVCGLTYALVVGAAAAWAATAWGLPPFKLDVWVTAGCWPNQL
jgi:hypothetical protein